MSHPYKFQITDSNRANYLADSLKVIRGQFHEELPLVTIENFIPYAYSSHTNMPFNVRKYYKHGDYFRFFYSQAAIARIHVPSAAPPFTLIQAASNERLGSYITHTHLYIGEAYGYY